MTADGAGLASAPGPSAAPVLAARYEIRALLGVGGMGSVYRVRDRELDEDVALKVLRRELTSDPDMVERFRREVKLARRVTHPNVVRTFDIGEHEGDKFLTMELIEGEALSSRIERDPPTFVEARRIGSAICAGLEAAHAVGVVHRDLKPDNVLVAEGGRVAITDFGIARAVQQVNKTLGAVLGTPIYMAPEQVLGRADIDQRADVYAFGVMLYEMLARRPPWGGDSPYAIAVARLVEPPPDPRAIGAVPDDLAKIALRCMAREPEARFPNAAEVRAALERARVRRPGGSLPPAGRALSRHPAGVRSVAVLPLEDAGGAAYLAAAMPDILREALGAHPALRLPSRGEVRRLRTPRAEVRAVGRELGAEVVIDAVVRVEGGRAELEAKLVNVSDGIQLWSGRFEQPLERVIDIADRLARYVARALAVAEPATLPPGPRDLEASELFLRARAARDEDVRDGNDRAIAELERALLRAPDDPWINGSYALALTRRMLDVGAPAAELDEAEAMAMKAIAAAPGLVEGYVAQARLRMERADDAGAAATLAAIASRSSCGDLHHALGVLLVRAGDLDHGVAALRTAASMHTMVAPPRADLAWAYALAGEWPLADAVVDGAQAADRRYSPFFIAVARLSLWLRDAQRARAWLGTIDGSPPVSSPLARALFEAVATSSPGAAIALLHQRLSQAETTPRLAIESWQMLAELEMARGDHDAARTAIDEADRLGLADRRWLDDCPLLAPLRRSGAVDAAHANVAARADALLLALAATGFDLP